MSYATYTAEDVEAQASRCQYVFNNEFPAHMLRDYATLLREHEPAKAVVTDELAERVLNRYVNECISHLDEAPVHLRVTAMRVALEAVVPMLASARVAVEMPAEFGEWFGKNYPGPDTIIGNPHWHAPRIWRAARRALLAAAPKLETEE